MRLANATRWSTRLIALLAGVAASLGAPFVSTAAASGYTVSGNLWHDDNRDQAMNNGETGISGMHVYLEDSGATQVLQSSVTDSQGFFSFPNVAPGNYRIEVDGADWDPMKMTWVPTTTGGALYPRLSVNVSGNTYAPLGVRQIVRSTTLASPISSYVGTNGLRVQSYDDVVTAQQLYNDLMQGSMVGSEAAYVTVRFDYSGSSATSAGVSQDSSGRYVSYSSVSDVSYASWFDSGDDTLFHEYGHSWSLYYAYLVQQDPNLNGYLQARGLLGDPRVNTSYAWSPREMIAEDYRELFGTPSAAGVSQMNTAIPRASDVPGLRNYLATTFQTPATPGSPTGLSAAPANAQVNLTWSAPTTGGVQTGYHVYRNGALVATVSSPTYTDSAVSNGTTYSYSVSAYNTGGESAQSAQVAATPVAPPTVSGLSASPTAVKSSTTITFSVSASAGVTVRILNSSGATVRTLLNNVSKIAGPLSVAWDRTNDSGKRVPSGSYQVQVTASNAGGSANATTSLTVS